MTDPLFDPERRHQTRAWKLLEALDRAPFKIEDRLPIIQAALDAERVEALSKPNRLDGLRYLAARESGDVQGF